MILQDAIILSSNCTESALNQITVLLMECYLNLSILITVVQFQSVSQRCPRFYGSRLGRPEGARRRQHLRESFVWTIGGGIRDSVGIPHGGDLADEKTGCIWERAR